MREANTDARLSGFQIYARLCLLLPRLPGKMVQDPAGQKFDRGRAAANRAAADGVGRASTVITPSPIFALVSVNSVPPQI